MKYESIDTYEKARWGSFLKSWDAKVDIKVCEELLVRRLVVITRTCQFFFSYQYLWKCLSKLALRHINFNEKSIN